MTLPDTFLCICLFCERRFRSPDGPLEDLCPRCRRRQAIETRTVAATPTLDEVVPQMHLQHRMKARLGMSWNEDV